MEFEEIYPPGLYEPRHWYEPIEDDMPVWALIRPGKESELIAFAPRAKGEQVPRTTEKDVIICPMTFASFMSMRYQAQDAAISG